MFQLLFSFLQNVTRCSLVTGFRCFPFLMLHVQVRFISYPSYQKEKRDAIVHCLSYERSAINDCFLVFSTTELQDPDQLYVVLLSPSRIVSFCTICQLISKIGSFCNTRITCRNWSWQRGWSKKWCHREKWPPYRSCQIYCGDMLLSRKWLLNLYCFWC